MAGLDSRVWLVSRIYPGETKYGAVDSPGGPQFWGTVDSVIAPIIIICSNPGPRYLYITILCVTVQYIPKIILVSYI